MKENRETKPRSLASTSQNAFKLSIQQKTDFYSVSSEYFANFQPRSVMLLSTYISITTCFLEMCGCLAGNAVF